MRRVQYVLCCVVTAVMTSGISATALAEPDDIPRVIEHFIAKRFPQAHGHFWVVNSTEWGAEDEVVVDFNAVVRSSHDQNPTEERFLLLIVAGELVAMHSVPLGARIFCTPEKDAA